MKKIIFAIIALCSITLQAQIVCLDSVQLTPISEVILQDHSGKVVGVSDNYGRFSAVPVGMDTLYFSHIGYYDKLVMRNEWGDSILLSPRFYKLPDFIVDKNVGTHDYYKLQTITRTYQYIDSLPIYYTEALVDYYVPAGSKKLKYVINSVRAYKNDDYINESKIEAGALNMGNNGLINFLKNSCIPLAKDYNLKGNEDKGLFTLYRDNMEVGKIERLCSGDYELVYDYLKETKASPKTVFGRRTEIIRKVERQTLPVFSTISELRPYDFSTYQLSIQLSTQYKDTKPVSLYSITEIYLLSKEGLSKKEFKSIDTDDFFGLIKHSYNVGAKEWEENKNAIPSVPEPIILSIGNNTLKLIPEK